MKIDDILTWIIIVLGLILVVTIFVIPKNHCEVCDFDGVDGSEFYSNYASRCLQSYGIFEDNPNLPSMDSINLEKEMGSYSSPRS